MSTLVQKCCRLPAIPPRSSCISSQRTTAQAVLFETTSLSVCIRDLKRSRVKGTALIRRRFTSKEGVAGPGPSRGHRGCIVMASGEADPVREWILSDGGATRITSQRAVGGGSGWSSCYNYETDTGSFFVKTSSKDPGMFEAEAAGLQAMYDTHTIKVPRPLKVGPMPRRGSFIIMEYIAMGSSKGQAELGRQLALMHKAGTSDKGFGFVVDNTIGATPQVNPWCLDWVEFFRDHRLGFQLNLIRKSYGDNDLCEKGQQLLEALPKLLGGIEVVPALLHGDLWSGNVAADGEGNPVILDPACYYGHSEAEFGMSWCAGFGQAFYDAYHKVIPRTPGFEQRVEIYKLYHYLNHYNLFGSGYRGSCMDIIRRALS